MWYLKDAFVPVHPTSHDIGPGPLPDKTGSTARFYAV